MKTLLAITTYNQLKYTKLLIESLNSVNLTGIDVIFIDDVSTDGTIKYLTESKHLFKGREIPKGLTESWNIAYRMFKNKNYDNLIIANNDILLSQGSLNEMISLLKTNSFVVPLSTKKGAGHNWKEQAIEKYYPNLINAAADHKKFKLVQKQIEKSKKRSIKILNFNGFMFGINKKIIVSEFNNTNLFNPKLINVGQETDLQKRLIERPTLALRSFVFHFKGVSFPIKGLKNGKDIRQNLNLYH